jgi:PAS domain S-box-containing protein/putative nucleotidyltransferase with HDIG domain
MGAKNTNSIQTDLSGNKSKRSKLEKMDKIHRKNEETWQETETRFRILFESSPDGIYVTDLYGKILDVNLAASLLHEMGKGELVGKNMLELIHVDTHKQFENDLPKLLSGETSYYETCFRTSGEASVPVELRIRTVKYAKETTQMFYVRDVSERIRVGESFMESQRALSNFMSNLPGLAYRCLNDKKWTMKFVSQGCSRLTGYLAEDLIDNKKISFGKIIPPEFQKHVWETKQKALKKEQAYQLEYKIITSDGKELWVWEQGRGVYNLKGKLMSCEGIIIDIDNLKQTEEALRESEVRFRSLIENVSSIAVQGFNKNRNLIFWNKASEALYGYSKEDAIGENLEKLIIPEYNRQEVTKDIQNWIKTEEAIPAGEQGLMRKDGSIFEAHSSHVMFKNMHGEPEFYNLDVDLTELNQAKKDLQKSIHNLQKTFEGTVLALMSAVEMRDPYTAGHQVGVAKLACAIARELGLDGNQIEGLRIGGMLHDIGKLNIPSEILTKPGGLTDLEYKLMQTHPQFGFEILRTINFPWPIAQMVLQHHEKMNGSGYPQKLKRDKIILEARIITVADVVEPMSSHRPYRPALGIDAALTEIKRGKGKHYDPKIVEACLRLFEEKGFSFDKSG